MLQLVFSDAQYWENFLPLTYTRPVADMRVGILTFRERWEKLLNKKESFFITEEYLHAKYAQPKSGEALVIVPNFLPSEGVLNQIKNLKIGEALVYENEIIASRISSLEGFSLAHIENTIDIEESLVFFKRPWDLFSYNDKAIRFDFDLVTKGRKSQPIPPTTFVKGNKEDVFIEEGVDIDFSFLNTKDGPVYIGKNAKIMENVSIKGPVAICDHVLVKFGTQISGASTFGPHCKICGEAGDVVMFGYSSKAHGGYLGNSVIGEWCNMGAGTNASNLKNNYSLIKMWSYKDQNYIDTHLQFCGTIMGDHGKTAINTRLNSGTVVGVAANIFKPEFPPHLVNNFSWGGNEEDPKFFLEKAYETAKVMMARRNITLTEADKSILKYIYENF